MHGSVMVTHFREWWLFGAFFLVVCPAQLAWAAAVHRRPEDRRLLMLGLVGNLAIVALWAITRTVGLPFGPDSGQAESVHLEDVVATVDEIGIALVCAALLRGHAPTRLVPVAWLLAAVSLFAAFSAGTHS